MNGPSAIAERLSRDSRTTLLMLRFDGIMSIFAIAGCVACGGYWFHAGDELGYPRWLGAVVSVALFLAMYWVWPASLLWALGAQIAAALTIGCLGSARLMMRR